MMLTSSSRKGVGWRKVALAVALALCFLALASELVAASNATLVYRSASGAAGSCPAGQPTVNCPKIRQWFQGGNGTLGSEIVLPTALSPPREFTIKYSPLGNKTAIVTQTDEGNLTAYICTGNCTTGSNWVPSYRIGNVAKLATHSKRFDFDFESATGDLVLVYGVVSPAAGCDMAYLVLPAGNNTFNGTPEICLDSPNFTTDMTVTWLEMDRNLNPLSEEIVLGYIDSNNSDVNSYVWNGANFSNFNQVSLAATSTSGRKAMTAKFNIPGTAAVVTGASGGTGDVIGNWWNGSQWTLSNPGDLAGASADVQWMVAKSDADDGDFMLVSQNSGPGLTTSHWNYSRNVWTNTVDFDGGVDTAVSRVADFSWRQVGDEGRVNWDTDTTGTTWSTRNCTPSCTSGTGTLAGYPGTGAWVQSSRNPTLDDTVSSFWLRLNNTNWLQAIVFNGSEFTSYGAAGLVTNSTNTTLYEAFGMDFEPSQDCGKVFFSMNLTRNLTAQGMCLEVRSSNIVIDCKGNTITYDAKGEDAAFGIEIGRRNNVTVQNCVIRDNSSTGAIGIGINVSQANYTRLINNTIVTNGTNQQRGIDVQAHAFHTLIENNTIVANGSGTDVVGIRLVTGVQQANISGNSIAAQGGAHAQGIAIGAGANNSVLRLNNITTQGALSNGIAVVESAGNTFDATLLNNTVQWVNVSSGSTVTFTNTSFEMPDGRINYVGSFQISARANITKDKLNISSNNAFVNSSNLSFLNTSAHITLRGIAFTDPAAFVDFDDDGLFARCPASICTELSYANSVFTFAVTRFTSYAARESPPQINVTLHLPLPNFTTNVSQNESFLVNATVFCTGTTGSCGNVSAYVRRNVTVAPAGWFNTSFQYRREITMTEPQSLPQNETHVLVGFTLDSGRLRNENATLLVCNNTQVPFDAYALGVSGEFVTNLEGVAELNFTAGEAKACHLYYDPDTNATEFLPLRTGWFSACDNAYDVCGVYGNISTSTADVFNYTRNISSTITCGGDADSFTTNHWCFFKAPASGNLSFATSSDDGSALFVNGTLASNNQFCQGETCRQGSYTGIAQGRYYRMEVDYDESGGGNVLNAIWNVATCSGATTVGNFIDTECYPYFGDEWEITPTVAAEQAQSGEGFVNISASPGDTPLYTSSLNPQSCLLNAGQSCVLNWTVFATGEFNTTYIVNVNASSNNTDVESNISANATVRIVAGAVQNVSSVSVAKSGFPDPVLGGQLLNYTLNITSTGNVNASNVTVVESYPAQVIFQAAEPAPLPGTNNTFVVGNLSPNAFFQVNITVLVNNLTTERVTINNTANISFDNFTDQNPSVLVLASTTVNACPAAIYGSATLSSNLTSNGTCITFGADNIFLDCAGNTITYSANGSNGVFGVRGNGRSNVTAQNCVIRDNSTFGLFTTAINFTGTNRSLVLNNSIFVNSSNFSYGILFQDNTHFNRIINNTVQTKDDGAAFRNAVHMHGIVLENTATFTNITGNRVIVNGSDDSNGIRLITGTVTNNIIANNTVNALGEYRFAHGMLLYAASNNTIADNTISVNATRSQESRGIFLLQTQESNLILRNRITVVGGATENNGIRISTNAVRNIVQENTITVNSSDLAQGIHIREDSQNNTMRNNTVRTGGNGSENVAIALYERSGQNNITNNVLEPVGGIIDGIGVWVQSGSNLTLVANNTIRTSGSGTHNHGVLAITNVSRAAIIDNVIFTNGTGTDNYGVFLVTDVTFSLVERNTITTNGTGFVAGMRLQDNANNNTVRDNTIVANGNGSDNHGIFVFILSSNNTITHNRIRTNGSASNAGVRIETNSNLNRVLFNNISTEGAGSAGIQIIDSTGTVLNATLLNNTVVWMNTSGASNSTMENTTFSMPNGDINLLPAVQVNGNQLVTKPRLNISFNLSYVNDTNLTFFSTTSIVTLRGISFDDPQPTVRFAETDAFAACPANICTEDSYANNVFTFNVTQWSAFSSRNFVLDACPATITSSATLAQNLTSNTDCITFGADNLFLNCSGYTIIYGANGSSAASAILAAGRVNITVRDCILLDNNSNGSLGNGFNITHTNNSVFVNNTITPNGTANNKGFFLGVKVNTLLIENNTMFVVDRSSGAAGVSAFDATNISVRRNAIVLNASGSYGVSLVTANGSSMVNNTLRLFTIGSAIGIALSDGWVNSIENNTVQTGLVGGLSNVGIYLSTAHETNITGNIVTTNGTTFNTGISLDAGSQNNTVRNNTIATNGTTGSAAINMFNGGLQSTLLLGNRIVNNVIVSTGATGNADGIRGNFNVTRTIIAHNVITTGGTGENTSGIELTGATLNNVTNNTILFVPADNAGIFVSGEDNWFVDNNITTNTTNSYGIRIERANGTSFFNTTLSNTTEWIISDAFSGTSNFTNTTFAMQDGSITILALAQLNGTQNVTKAKLNVSFNLSYVNDTNLTFFNVTSVVTLRNITLASPSAFVRFAETDAFAECSATICSTVGFADSVFTFNVTQWSAFAAREVPACPRNITVSTVLSENISCKETAVQILADNVTLDCAGFSIMYGTNGSSGAEGVTATGRTNVTVQDCAIRDNTSSGAGSIGIHFNTVTGGSVQNASLFPNGSSDVVGLLLNGSSGSRMFNSTVRYDVTTGSTFGVRMSSGSNSNVTDSYIGAIGTVSADAIRVDSGTGFALVRSTVGNANDVVRILGTSDHRMVNNTVNVTILLTTPTRVLVENNTQRIVSAATNPTGVSLTAGSRNNITGNDINVTVTGVGSAPIGIALAQGSSHQILGNTLFVNGSGARGMRVVTATTQFNNFTANRVTVFGGNAVGIQIADVGSAHQFTHTNITVVGGRGIVIADANATFDTTLLNDTPDWLNTSANTANNFTNTTFEMPDGSIRFPGLVRINGTQDVTKARLNVSLNRSYVNDSNLTFFNTSAVVTLRGIALLDPDARIDYGDDGEFVNCPAAICTEVSYANNIFVFNVTQFSAFAARDNPTPRVINLSPFNNQQLLVNGTLNITANVTASLPLDAVLANVTLPNGTVVQVRLLNQTRDIFNITWLNLTLRGRYNITFLANGTEGDRNFSVSTFFIRQAFAIVDIVDAASQFINFTIAINSNASGILSLNISPNHTVERLVIDGHAESSPFSVLRLAGEINQSDIFPKQGNYTIDPRDMNFTSINATRNATSGDRAYKCAEFNYSTLSCEDTCAVNASTDRCEPWRLIANVTPGERYTFVLLNATDPGFAEYNSTQVENESNTTSGSPVNSSQANFTPATSQQFLLFGYAELQGGVTTADVRAQLLLNDTLLLGNQSWQPDTSRTGNPPGDYAPFFSHKLQNLSFAPQILSMQAFAEPGQTTFFRRARAIALRVNASDAITNETDENFTQLPNAFSQVVNLSFTPALNQTLLIIASAEILPNATNESVEAQLLMNATPIGTAVREGEVASDIDLFATFVVVNATANVTQNFTLQARSEGVANKGVRRARITAVPLNDVFFNQSEALTTSTVPSPQLKLSMRFTLASDTSALIVASANISLNQETNGRFVTAAAFIDELPVGNMTIGMSDLTDAFSFLTVQTTNLTAGAHNATIRFHRVGGIGSTDARISSARITVIPVAEGTPDIFANVSEMNFNVSHPREGENITINATIRNIGTAPATNVLVQFFDNTSARFQIGDNFTIASLPAGAEVTVNVTQLAIIGNRTIVVAADPFNTVVETNETNNNATRQFNVQAWSIYFGNNVGNLTLDGASNLTKFRWNASDAGFVYFFDLDSNFSFAQLQALGRNTTNGTAVNDFGEADVNLNMTGFNDSVVVLFTVDNNSTPNETRNLTIFDRAVNLVPVLNSTNAGTFFTGILWDTADDTNGQYDLTDKEDLVFVANINLSKTGASGSGIDYEARVPSLLRQYRPALNQTAFLVEIG